MTLPQKSSALLVTLALAVPSYALGAGSEISRKEPAKAIRASTLVPLPTLPSVSASESFNGCGGRRIRDPKTHQCRGPADFGH
jgi:hypothetical protein